MGFVFSHQSRMVLDKAKSGWWFWKVKGGNHRTMMVGTHRCATKDAAYRDFKEVVNTKRPAKNDVYVDEAGKWRWNMQGLGKSPDKLFAASYESFHSKSNAVRAAKRCTGVLYCWGDCTLDLGD